MGIFLPFVICLAALTPPGNQGYYRFPAIHDKTVVFTAEGDLWEVGIDGGMARRLTSHPGEESHAAFSPDGKSIAFSADYEGPTEVYTMPAEGVLPKRRTYEGEAMVTGWAPDGKVLYATRRYSTLPEVELATIDADNKVTVVPLAQAAQGSYNAAGEMLFFTRLPFQGSHSKRYQGGTAQQLWAYSGKGKATPLTADFAGTSKDAMWWKGRVYFLSDRDGTMNLWSMDEQGKDLKELTTHQGWDAKDASLSEGRIVYQMGADLRLYDIATGADTVIPIELSSDFDHLREHWIKNPSDYVTAVSLSPDGSSAVLTSRGRVFVAPLKNGRFVDVEEHQPGRYRDARFLDAKNLLVLSTESGEAEFWKVPADGSGKGEQLTSGGKVLRWEGVPSPDGKWVAHQDKDNQLWLLNVATKAEKLVDTVKNNDDSGPQFEDVRWSPDSRWVSYGKRMLNLQSQIMLYNIETGSLTAATTDRYSSRSAAWSADGKFLYFLSDRSLHSVVRSPWGSRSPDPYFDKSDKIYVLALTAGERSPFEPADELHPDAKEGSGGGAESRPAESRPADTKPAATKPADTRPAKMRVGIDLDGIASRLQEVPVAAGNYDDLEVAGKRLCFESVDREDHTKDALLTLEIANRGDKPEPVMEGIGGFDVSADGKKLLIRKQGGLYIVDAGAKEATLSPKTLADDTLDLRGWTFSVIPADEFKEEFADAWRLDRDYFYDKNMHGVDWPAMREKYGALLDRVRDREELSDLIADMVSELSALHTFVHGGDIRRGPDQIGLSSLGVLLERDAAAGGYVVEHIYQSDPDHPEKRSPLARPGVDVGEGDVLVSINHQPVLSAVEPEEFLRNQAGKDVLLEFHPKGKKETRAVVVKPMSMGGAADLRYGEWEYTRRAAVDKASDSEIGYIHLRAMGPGDIARWVEDYDAVFNRAGLIIDVRHNAGGSIDSWILSKLERKVWMYWQPRVGVPQANPPGAFRGHIVVLCDAWTASDGEAFTEGFRRLGLGKVIGTRTWGGEIWLSGSNFLSDRGIATTGEDGVFGPGGKWLIEGRGVEPDIVDNPPHATFEAKDAQLDAAIAELQDEIKKDPVAPVTVPKYPDKSVKYGSPAVKPKAKE